MLGMIPGNGHPYSWSAIINGYNPEKMAQCPYPVIAQYLGAQPAGTVQVPGVQVTHIWTDNPDEAPLVAEAALIPNVVARPEDVIGQVDAVLVATDDGDDHVERARPFVEAGLPVFIDKPLATNLPDLKQFIAWKKSGAKILSSSGMRYAPEFQELENQPWLWLTAITPKTWERYGIHLLEPIYKLLGPGFQDVRSERTSGSDIVYLRHQSGTQVTLAAIESAVGSFGVFTAYGKDGFKSIRTQNTYIAFRSQLLSFIEFVRTGQDPFPFSQTVEMMAGIIAGILSRNQNGKQISIPQLLKELE